MKRTTRNSPFLYVNAKGRRILTPFACAVTMISIALVFVVVYGVVHAKATRSVVGVTAQPITLAAYTPTSSPEATAPATTSSGCPTDPSEWDFVDVAPESNYKRIEPTCVYDGLAQTVKWIVLSSSYGYDVVDAARMLGYEGSVIDGKIRQKLPYNPLAKIAVRAMQGEQVTTITDPIYPLVDRNLYWWEVDSNKRIAVETFMLQGCYRTYDVIGNEKQYIWATYENYDYDALCQISVDSLASGWYIGDYGNNVIVSLPVKPQRSLLYFGYDETAGIWNFFGLTNETDYAADDNVPNAEYALMQEWYGVPVWDSAWFQAFNFSAKPLPEGWEQRNTGADYDALMKKYELRNK